MRLWLSFCVLLFCASIYCLPPYPATFTADGTDVLLPSFENLQPLQTAQQVLTTAVLVNTTAGEYEWVRRFFLVVCCIVVETKACSFRHQVLQGLLKR